MKPRASRSGFASQSLSGAIVILCIALLSPSVSVALAQEAPQENAAPAEEAPKLPTGELDSLVAPIALYSDQLLAQTLAASTYPLEIIQLQQWMDRNKNLKDKALADAVSKAKPAGAKGTYIQRVAVSSTMGPGVKVEPGTLLG